MLSEILLFPVTGPARGIGWVIGKIKDQVDDEMYSPKALRRRLVALNEALDRGEISEEDFEAEEADLLDALDRAQEEEAAQDE